MFAAQLHREQRRKGSNVPYVSHLLAVSALVIEHGGDEDQAIAALLHDAIEDQGGPKTRDEILRRFGERVTGIVEGCTDSQTIPKPPWIERKLAYIAGISEKSPSVPPRLRRRQAPQCAQHPHGWPQTASRPLTTTVTKNASVGPALAPCELIVPFSFAPTRSISPIRSSRGRLYDRDNLAQTVAIEFAADNGDRRYRHIVVDEGQDFSPVMLRSLVAASVSFGRLVMGSVLIPWGKLLLVRIHLLQGSLSRL